MSVTCPVNDISHRPLQNAMRLVKVAIQLDSGNRHKVTKNARDRVHRAPKNMGVQKNCMHCIRDY